MNVRWIREYMSQNISRLACCKRPEILLTDQYCRVNPSEVKNWESEEIRSKKHRTPNNAFFPSIFVNFVNTWSSLLQQIHLCKFLPCNESMRKLSELILWISRVGKRSSLVINSRSTFLEVWRWVLLVGFWHLLTQISVSWYSLKWLLRRRNRRRLQIGWTWTNLFAKSWMLGLRVAHWQRRWRKAKSSNCAR